MDNIIQQVAQALMLLH